MRPTRPPLVQGPALRAALRAQVIAERKRVELPAAPPWWWRLLFRGTRWERRWRR